MANVYSELLWRKGPLLPLTEYAEAQVPAGYVWVVRDILLWNQSVPVQGLYGITLGDSHGGILGGVFQPYCAPSVVYHQELRQVLNPLDYITAWTKDDYWYVRISGYQLTLP